MSYVDTFPGLEISGAFVLQFEPLATILALFTVYFCRSSPLLSLGRHDLPPSIITITTALRFDPGRLRRHDGLCIRFLLKVAAAIHISVTMISLI